MKKTLIALAAVVAAGGAFAQSTVSLTGGVSFAFQSVPSAVGNISGLAVTDGSLYVNATEDLGGGMKAAAFMNFDNGPAQFNDPTGFNRRAMGLSLMGGFGRVSFANTRSSDLIASAWISPSNLSNGFYDNGIQGRAPIDALTYTTPSFSGFTASLAYVESGGVALVAGAQANVGYSTVNGNGDGSGKYTTTTSVLGLQYANGPLAGALAFKTSSYNNDYPVPAAAIARSTNAEGVISYDFGVAKVALGFDTATAGVVASSFNDATSWALGLSVPIGAVTVGADWVQRDNQNAYQVGMKYDLSKRTNVNLSFGRSTVLSNALVDGSQYRLSLNHAF
jgi:predicted porin